MSEPENPFRAPLTQELAPLFPNYQILTLIATGGMGAVYHAIQTSLEREVAIKILPVEFGKDPEFCEGFVAEARAMAKLNHPNLISVYDFGDVNGMLFIVMEYVPGQSLHDAYHGTAVEPAEVVRLLSGICQGLAHAHEYGILHRDIKPANILLDSRLQPKIGDFGLARPLDAKVGVGETIYGTPGYTAPEVLQVPHTIDQRADIFSVGVLLHELLTGLLPGSDPRSPSAISHCDPRFDAVVRKATHPIPQQRYQNAAEIADALRKISSTAGPRVVRTASPKDSRAPLTRTHSMQSSKKGGGGLLLILLLIAAVGVVYFFRDRIFDNVDASTAPAAVVNPQPEPVMPAAVVLDPGPVKPEPGPVVVETGADPGELKPVPPPQPKFDVEGFLAHAKSVMLKRCGPEIAKHDEALEKNLESFQRNARRLARRNLEKIYYRAVERELDDFIAKCKADGSRVGEELEHSLTFNNWLVELHQEYQDNEAEIDEGIIVALAGQAKTYLHGLGLRVQALREDDPEAADLIQDEIDKVNDSPDYFAGMMLEAARND